ncbi:MAG: outer membrane protein assembly factor BamA [Candidatus Cloacimonetes bacterium]|nr:outer membrane protein assembly factor BamA [Candidatus Cloacimonadota bacterium]
MKKAVFFGLLLSIVFALSATPNMVSDIVISGNTNIDEALIQSVLSFELGGFLTGDNTSASIKNLYQLGVFDDVSISIEEKAEGIVVYVDVKEFPIINKVKFHGNTKLSDKKLKEISGLQKGAYWSPFLRTEITNKIKKEYKEKSYHFAKLLFEPEVTDDNMVNLEVYVDEGSKIRVKTINFHGNREIPAKKLRSKMTTKQKSLFRSGKFEREKFDEDLQVIIKYLNNKGYIDSRVISHEENISDEKNMVIDIYLYEGEQYRFGKVSISGNIRFTDEALLKSFTFREDELFDMEKFEKQLQQARTMYYEDGYIYSVFDELLIKVGEKVNIELTVHENIRAKIHKIHIIGNRKTKEKVIRRQLMIHPGDYFQQSLVMRSQQNIYNMGFFEPNLNLDYEPINENGDIDLIIHLTDKPSGTANAGVGYNSNDGFVGQLSVSQNNLLGNSWSSSVSWQFGGTTQDFEFSFNNPYLYDTNTLGGFSLYHTQKQWSSYNYQVHKNGFSVRVGRPVWFLNFAKVILGYSYSTKKYDLLEDENESTSQSLIDLSEKGWQDNSSVSLTFSRDSRDNVFFPTTGTQFTLYNEIGGGPVLMGNFDYYKFIAESRWYIKTFWKLALRTKWRLGYVTEYDDSSEPPPEEKFYLGGTGPDGIRGYPDRSVGPDDGGKRMFTTSAEYAIPMGGDAVVGLLFFDAGNSFNRFEEFNLWKLKKGTGIGIRVRSPFGLIGFDYAYSLDEDNWEPHFQFGTTF